MIIVGFIEEAQRVGNVLKKTQIVPEIAGFVSPGTSDSAEYLGNTSQLMEIVKIHKVDEIVFCAKDITSLEIIRIMTQVTGIQVDFKIAPPESLSIIGSNSINTAGDLYMINFNSIAIGRNRRKKRLFDLVASLIVIATWPFLVPFFKGYRRNFLNALKVISSTNTWVGYCTDTDHSGLPVMKKGISDPSIALFEPDQDTRERINMEYARDYKITNDFTILWKFLFNS